jgi:hypothetical protein
MKDFCSENCNNQKKMKKTLEDGKTSRVQALAELPL